MRKKFLLIAFSIYAFGLSLTALGQTETHGAANFTPPKNWNRSPKEGVALYTNSTGKSYCLIAVYQSKPSSGKIETDFKSEWNELVVKAFEVKEDPKTEPVQESNGWKSLAGTATFSNEAGTAAALLTTTSGYGLTVSILIILNDQQYMPTIEKFLNSVSFNKSTGSPSSPGNSSQGNNQIVGTWTKSSSSPMSLAGTIQSTQETMVNQGYFKSRYIFNTDGTYSYKGESWGGYSRSNEYWIFEESGTFSVVGNSLTIYPKASKATLKNREGVIQKTQNNPLETTTYKWKMHYFEGINEMDLVLEPSQPTIRDGKTGGNSLFPNAYLYAQGDKLEWKFQ